jgi:hypothetical protein
MQDETQSKKEGITAQRAAKIAIDHYRRVTGDAQLPTVEEFELSDSDKCWLITLGVRKGSNDAISSLYGRVEVEYKVFKIDTKDGKVVSMKIREV